MPTKAIVRQASVIAVFLCCLLALPAAGQDSTTDSSEEDSTSSTTEEETTTTEQQAPPNQRVIGPKGATGTIRRSGRRQDRRDGEPQVEHY